MPATIWTTDRVDRLKTLWQEGRSASEVARDLGAPITRNAVLGKVMRLGLCGRGTTKPAPAIPTDQCLSRRPRRSAPVMAHRAYAPSRPPNDAPSVGLRSILTVGFRECRFPYGDPAQPGFAVCGRATARGAYCADHAAVACRGQPMDVAGLIKLAGV